MLHRPSLPVTAQVASTSGCRPPARACLWAVGPAGEKLHLPHMPQWTMLPGLRSALSVPGPRTSAARRDSAVFRHPGELDLNLREYMVVLEKPVGLTLAPDPKTGQVVIQDIKPNSPAQKCGLIQVGDVVKCCSAVFGDDMWVAADIRRVRWAINSRLGDVKLLLERGRRLEGGLTAWYCGGKAGVATRERDGMQLPYAFNGTTSPEEAASLVELPGAGRTLQAVFHRNTITQPPPSRRASTVAAARSVAVQRLRRELSEVRNMRVLDLEAIRKRSGTPDGFVLPPTGPSVGAQSGGGSSGIGAAAAAASSSSPRAPSSGGGSDGPPPPVVDVVAPPAPSFASGGGAGNGSPNGSPNGSNGNGNSNGGVGDGGGSGLLSGLKLGPDSTGSGAAVAAGPSSDATKKKVVSFLPWLLVACGRLEHRDIATIASSRSLGAILELSLTRSQQSSGCGPTATAAAIADSSSSGNGSSSGVKDSSSSSSSSKGGSYLVVRGSDLAPLASDVGRVSYQDLLASGATAVRASFSALPTSRYDPLRVRHLLNAAASLQRLAFRRGGKLHRARRDACAVLLHCDPGMDADVAVLLAGWLHWYGRLPLQEAILAAETAMGATVDQGLLEAGTLALLQGARERCSKVVLTWKYGGLTAYVAGDVVASWSARVPMVRCRSPMGCKGDTHPGHFFLEVQGLRPGVYYYKYIVDGTWAVDSYSSKVLDAAGNWNNVLVVPEPPVVLTSREGLALARWQAARLALEAKMGVIGTPRAV
ncbi:hypothetical protein Vretifemale_7358 [Volvox reticuliferus]|nr:hypothetical protein Vretifemale_7358 [Volvox reticuliferus]